MLLNLFIQHVNIISGDIGVIQVNNKKLQLPQLQDGFRYFDHLFTGKIAASQVEAKNF